MLPHTEDREQIGEQAFPLNVVAVRKRPRKTWVVLTIALIVVATLLASGIYSRVKARTTLNEETARAAGLVVGQHDFTSFAAVDPERGRGEAAMNVRTIFSSSWEREGEELVYTVRGSGYVLRSDA